MNVSPYIKRRVKSFLKEIKIYLIFFIVFPMILAKVYGVMNEDAFQGKNHFQPVRINFDYNKNSDKGKIFDSILKEDNVRLFIEDVDSDDVECKVIISENFKEVNIQKVNGSDFKLDIVENFIKSINENMDQYEVIINSVNKGNLRREDKEKYINSLLSNLKEINSEPVVKEKIIDGYRTLNSREYFTISMFSFASMMLIGILLKEFYKEKKQGIIRRTLVTPTSKTNYFFGYLLSTFVIIFIINIIYILVNRGLNIAFKDNMLFLIIACLIHSLLEISVIAMIVAFVKSETVANAIMSAIIIIPALIGGVFFNIDYIEMNFLRILASISPNSLILNLYKNLAISQGLKVIQYEIITSVILISILLILSFTKINFSWEEK